MKNKFYCLVAFSVLIVAHIFLLLKSSLYITPELIFPVWVTSNAKVFVSEIQSVYPPSLFYIVSLLYRYSNNLFFSVNVIQLLFILTIDGLLFNYLVRKFNFKLAILGLAFYIPWQVYFRGNYLWFDLATIPFVLLSFLFFEKYLDHYEINQLASSSAFLALGLLFKNTVLWIYILYFVWLSSLAITKSVKLRSYIKTLIILLIPLVTAIGINFLTVLEKTTFEFAFYWNFLIQNIIYPRMPTLQRSIESNYALPMVIILSIIIISCLVIEKYSKLKNDQKLFIYSFSFVSLANIYPRWSDFHVQPFLVFLTIAVIYAISLLDKLTKFHKKTLTLIGFVILTLTVLIFVKRISAERTNINVNRIDYISEYAPTTLTSLIKGKDIFVEDFSLYNGVSTNQDIDASGGQTFKLAITSPDKFFKFTSAQETFNFVSKKNPQLIIIPMQVQEREISGINLTSFEKLIKDKYRLQANVAGVYFIYNRETN